MARVHFLTVGEGDCSIIEHNSGHISVIDICGGNRATTEADIRLMEALEKPRGNFAMCKKPTNPINYLHTLGVKSIWRFILSHPDMDHMDGFDNLASNFSITNFWDSGARKEKPDFSGSPFKEEDWDRYVNIRDGKESSTTVVTPLAGSRFSYANKGETEGEYGDGLYISSPNQIMINDANESEDFNDASYIISYYSAGGKIIFPGDAHDKSWEYAIDNHKDDIENVSFLLAPHHGRKSGRDYSYLNTVNPIASLLGCAKSEHLAYHAWRSRDLYYFTQNQAGNVVLEIGNKNIDVYIENDKYAEESGGNIHKTNKEGYYYLGSTNS